MDNIRLPIHYADGLFITGTDTDIGKTVISAALTLALNGAYWKPIQAGLEGGGDSAAVQRMTAMPDFRIHRPDYELRIPRSPHEAAQREGVRIALSDFVLPKDYRPLVVEGAGGVLVPLNETTLMVDLMAHLGLPVLMVARAALGTINHTLLSIEALRQRGLQIIGVVMNGPPDEANREAIEHYGKVQVIAEVPVLASLSPRSIAGLAKQLRRALDALE